MKSTPVIEILARILNSSRKSIFRKNSKCWYQNIGIVYAYTGQELSFGAACPTCTEEYYSLLDLQQKDNNI